MADCKTNGHLWNSQRKCIMCECERPDDAKAQNDELRARIAQLEVDNRSLRDCGIQWQRTTLALEAENQRLRADAERLNALDQWAQASDSQHPQFSWDRDNGIRSAIDAAMGK